MSEQFSVDPKSIDLNNFFYLCTDILCAVNLEGYVQIMSPSTIRVLGYSQDELVGKSIFHYCHPDDMVRTMKELSELAEGRRLDHTETRYQSKDGRYLWFSISAVLDKSSKLIFAIARDITNLKNETESLKQQIQKKNRFL